MKVFVWFEENGHASEYEEVVAVKRERSCIHIQCKNAAFTYPWHAVFRVKTIGGEPG